jgi:hypothetical protein
MKKMGYYTILITNRYYLVVQWNNGNVECCNSRLVVLDSNEV